MDRVFYEKVSIIIPIYNVERYLIKCLESAINQTHQNKEIVLVDDGSTDGSPKIIEYYKNRYTEVVVISTENRGQSSARNAGLRVASGDYILFLDSDDWIDKDTLELCLKAFQEHMVDIVFFNAEAFADGVPESEVKKFNYIRPKQLMFKKEICEEIFRVSIENSSYTVSPCLYMYKRESFLSEKFLDGIIHEDNLFTTQLLINNPRASAICLPNRFFHRRVRPGSTMTQKKGISHINGYFIVAEELLKSYSTLESTNIYVALNDFIQGLILSAIQTAYQVFQGKVPFKLRKKAIGLLFKISLRYISLRTALICIFPEVIQLKKILDRGLARK